MDAKKGKTRNEAKPVENTNKNPQSFLNSRPVHKKVLQSHKPQDYVYDHEI